MLRSDATVLDDNQRWGKAEMVAVRQTLLLECVQTTQTSCFHKNIKVESVIHGGFTLLVDCAVVLVASRAYAVDEETSNMFQVKHECLLNQYRR